MRTITIPSGYKPKTKCGKDARPGDIFWYQSRYDDNVVEGIIKRIEGSKLVSTNNVYYELSEVTLKPLSAIREEKIKDILDE